MNTRIDSIIIFFKDFYNSCREKHILILASSSTFFFFLCLIPTTLLLLSFSTWLFESFAPVKTSSFLSYIKYIIPDDIMPTFLTLFEHSKDILINNKNLNDLHYIILGVSSIGFFGSVWKSIDILTGQKNHGKFARTLYSFVSIAISFSFILLIISIPLIIDGLKYFFNTSFFKGLKLDTSFLEKVQNFEFFGVGFLSTLLLFLFFIFFFKFLLQKNANIKSTIVGSAFFTTGIIITKTIFLAYLKVVKASLLMNYGSLYSLMIFILWIFAIILIFYSAIVFTITISRHRYNIGLEQEPRA